MNSKKRDLYGERLKLEGLLGLKNQIEAIQILETYCGVLK
jgi:hypothetical protein